MLIVKRENAQSYTIKGDIALRNEVLKGMVWNHSQFQKGYQFTQAYKDGRWNGRVAVYKPSNVRAGYIQETLDVLDGNSIEWEWAEGEDPRVTEEIKYDEFFKFCTNLVEAVKPSFKKKHDIDLAVRDYQINAAWKFLNERTGIALHATSAGKSLTIAFILGYLFYKNLIKRAVILVPLQSLVTQFYRDLLDFGFKDNFVGRVVSGTRETTRPITVAMNNSTHNMIGSLEEGEFFDSMDLVICDEVHRSASRTVTESVLRFHNAQFFFGCTGTLPEDLLDKEVVHSLFGNVLDQRKLKELKEEYDAVSNVKIGILNFSYGLEGLMSRARARESTMDWHQEVEFLQNDFEFRNPFIIQTLINNFNKGKKVVVLVKNIDYGLKMYHKISEDVDRKERKVIYWMDGTMKLKDRDDIIQKCKKSKSPYIIVTNFQIFSTGVNIPNLDVVAMVDAGKSTINVAQTIGRGVRKSKNKTDVLILDCSCDLKYGIKHGRKRKKLYEEEGFIVMEKTIYRDEDD
ncbi:MAG: DEAD/DEAH box helicase family protein [Candidatus Heimdallarchaeaceae archaeon]